MISTGQRQIKKKSNAKRPTPLQCRPPCRIRGYPYLRLQNYD
nr:MAG TPA: hypothetical protein [Caudoviricetes sp.]